MTRRDLSLTGPSLGWDVNPEIESLLRRGSGEARGVVTNEIVGTGMSQFARAIDPDLPADFPSAETEGIIIAEVDAGFGIDDAVEEREQIRTPHGIPTSA